MSTALTTTATTALDTFGAKSLALMRRTVAKDCDQTEFDQFLHIARHVNLDPLRRQIYAFVFGKNDPDKRRMSIVTGIDGFRTISARTRRYRPDNRTPRYVYDPEQISDANPLGIVSCEVSIFMFENDAWHEVPAVAYWDEFAPIIETGEGGSEWQETGEVYPAGHAKAGKPKYRKVRLGETVRKLDPNKENWRKMGRLMIAKCAEAQAHRRAFPDDFSALEIHEEIDRAQTIELTATELADQGDAAKRLELIGGGNRIMVAWGPETPLDPIPVGKLGDVALDFIRTRDAATVSAWAMRNRHALAEYWAADKSGALEVKKAIEAKDAEWQKKQAEQAAARDRLIAESAANKGETA